ncbi:MAG: PEGA domain-containing protein [Deltaproteobacteria bacterium]|nr:PEGA domain-containing protein [Deltaproteobacteria bacterium]
MLDSMIHSTLGKFLSTWTAASLMVLLFPSISIAGKKEQYQVNQGESKTTGQDKVAAKNKATGRPRLLVVGIFPPSFEKNVDPKVGMRLAGDLERELSSSSKLDLFPNKRVDAALTEIDPAQVAAKELNKISKEVDRGKKLLDDLKLEDAIAAFNAAIEGYKKNLVYMKDYTPLVQALLQLSVAYFRIGEDEKGQKYLTQVLCLNPDLTLKEGEFPEIFQRIFDQVKKKALQGPKGSINIASSPPFSEIYLNGKKRGVTPLLVRDLIKGRYFLRVDKQGYKPYNSEIEVGDKEGELVQVNLEPEPRVVKYNKKAVFKELGKFAANQNWGSEFKKKAGLTAGWLGIDFMVFGLMVVGDEYEMTTFLYRTSDGAMLALPTIKMDYQLLNAAIELYKLSEVISEKITFFPDNPPPLVKVKPIEKEFGMVVAPPPPNPVVTGPGTGSTGTGIVVPGGPGKGKIGTEKEWYQKWWVWTLIAVGAGAVAGAGVGTYFLLKPSPKPSASVNWPGP